jgi:hypothetical protein
LFFTLFGVFCCHAQDTSSIHFPLYNNSIVRFGFNITINSTYFKVAQVSDLNKFDSLKSVTATPTSGFNLGLSADFKIRPRFRLIFSPDLAFATRELSYSFNGKSQHTNIFFVESTFLDLPLEIKLLTKRFRNFDGYVVGGGEYTYDLAHNNDSTSTPLHYLLPILRNNITCMIGGGISYYLTYFKFSFEVQYGFGITNLLIKDNTVYTQSLSGLYNRALLFTFRFEG